MITEADNERLQKRTEELVVALITLARAATVLVYQKTFYLKTPPKPEAPPVEKT